MSLPFRSLISFYELHNRHIVFRLMYAQCCRPKLLMFPNLANMLTFPLLNKIIQHLSEEDGCNDVRLLLKQEKIAHITLAPSLRFVNITICSTPSCQTIDQKSTSVFDVGPVCIKGEKMKEQ